MPEQTPQLSMENVERLWAEGHSIPLDLAPIALWHLFDPQPGPEPYTLPFSEEALGGDF